MGLTSWENAPDGKIVKTDVVVAKNYLEITKKAPACESWDFFFLRLKKRVYLF
jgi:hypothetical protein